MELSKAGQTQSSVRWMALILGLALGLRVALAMTHVFWFPDSRDYDALARSMIAGHGYQVDGLMATRMPGYPVFLAGVYELFGDSREAVAMVQAVMGGMIVWLTYLIGKRAGKPAGLAAAALAAVDPLSIGFSAAILSETLFTLLLMCAIWLCLRIMEAGGWYKWSVLGVVWVLAVYARAEALWCLIPLGIVVAWTKRGIAWKWWCAAGLAWALGIVFIWLSPWQMRNHNLSHDGYFRLTTLEGISLYEAVYSGADGGPKQDQIALPADMRKLNESQRNDAWWRMAWREIAGHPARVGWLAVRKIGRMWSPFFNAQGFQRTAVQAVMGLWQIPLFLLAIIGLFARIVPLRIKAVLLAPLLYFTAMHALFLGSVRYRVPLMPLVCIFAAGGIVFVAGKLRGDKPAGAIAV